LAVTERKTFRTAAQAAKALGVSAKALRVWERAGLLRPGRTVSGWRAYGPDDFARIGQILALRDLGVGLAQMRDLIAEERPNLAAVLKLQARALRRRQTQVEAALAVVTAAQRRLAKGATLSLDDLANLIRETAMSRPLNTEQLSDVFEPLWGKHFTPDELDSVRERGPTAPVDRAQMIETWNALFVEGAGLAQSGDPKSPQAQALAKRWKAALAGFNFSDDPALAEKAKAMWTEALADPAAAARLPINVKIRAFMQQAMAALDADEAQP
jgi:DNA-binding transcriptional MerR regulator